jgi:hypothetical protein
MKETAAMTRLLFALLAAFAALCAAAAAADLDKPDTPENFVKNLKPLVEGIAKARSVTLYEGLPHPLFERDLLKEELEKKKSVKFHGFPFYDEKIQPKPDDVKKLIALGSDKGSFQVYRGPKRCGGFHPDWLIEWKDGENVYQALICFHCGEAALYGPNNDLHTDLNTPKGQLEQLLQAYRKNRPEAKKEK